MFVFYYHIIFVEIEGAMKNEYIKSCSQATLLNTHMMFRTVRLRSFKHKSFLHSMAIFLKNMLAHFEIFPPRIQYHNWNQPVRPKNTQWNGIPMENSSFENPAKCLELVAHVPNVIVLRIGASLIRLTIRVRVVWLILFDLGHRFIRLLLGVLGILFAPELPPGIRPFFVKNCGSWKWEDNVNLNLKLKQQLVRITIQ